MCFVSLVPSAPEVAAKVGVPSTTVFPKNKTNESVSPKQKTNAPKSPFPPFTGSKASLRGPGSNGTLCPPSAQENPTPVSYMHYNIKLGEETCQKTFIWNRNHQKAERHKRGTPFRLWGVVRCRPARSINHWRRWRPPDQNARHINHSSTIYFLRHLPNPLTRKLTGAEALPYH